MTYQEMEEIIVAGLKAKGRNSENLNLSKENWRALMQQMYQVVDEMQKITAHDLTQIMVNRMVNRSVDVIVKATMQSPPKTKDICTVEPHHENEYECMDTYCALHKNKTIGISTHVQCTACGWDGEIARTIEQAKTGQYKMKGDCKVVQACPHCGAVILIVRGA